MNQLISKYRIIEYSSGLNKISLFYCQIKQLIIIFILAHENMIRTAPTLTPRSKSKKYSYKTTYSSNRLTIQPNLSKDSRVNKFTRQLNHNLHFSQTLPMANSRKRVPLTQSSCFNSTKPQKIMQQNKKQSYILKRKNEILDGQLSTQEKEIQLLRNQINSLKSALILNEKVHSKQSDELKSMNQELSQKFSNQVQEIEELKNQMKKLKQDYCFNTVDKSDFSDRIEKNQISRRVEYFQQYQEIAGSIKKEVECCANCGQKQKEMQQMKIKYSNELRSLESYVSFLKEKQVIAEVLQKQVSNKNQCIDYLRNQLQIEQNNSNHLLQVIRQLEQKLQVEKGKPRSAYERANESICTFRAYNH